MNIFSFFTKNKHEKKFPAAREFLEKKFSELNDQIGKLNEEVAMLRSKVVESSIESAVPSDITITSYDENPKAWMSASEYLRKKGRRATRTASCALSRIAREEMQSRNLAEQRKIVSSGDKYPPTTVHVFPPEILNLAFGRL